MKLIPLFDRVVVRPLPTKQEKLGNIILPEIAKQPEISEVVALGIGTIENKVDTKGRVSVPVEFRNALKNDDFQGVILFHSFTNKCIEGVSMARMEQMAEATDNMDLFGEENQNINSLIFSDARQMNFDITGRIIIPADLLEFAGIKDKALFVGRGKTFQIWEASAFYKAQNEIRAKAQENRPSLSFKRD